MLLSVTFVAVPPAAATTQIWMFVPSLAWNAIEVPSGAQAGCERAPEGPAIVSAVAAPPLVLIVKIAPPDANAILSVVVGDHVGVDAVPPVLVSWVWLLPAEVIVQTSPPLTYAIFVPSCDQTGSMPVSREPLSVPHVPEVTVHVWTVVPPTEKASFLPSGDHEGSTAPVTAAVPVDFSRMLPPFTNAMSPSAPLLVAASAPPPSGSRTRTAPARAARTRRPRGRTRTL